MPTLLRQRLVMTVLDGTWRLERVGGLLPPLVGVRKVIRDGHGWTTVGPLPGVPFDVCGLELRYRGPLSAFVDVLDPHGEDFLGRATFRGRLYGRFRMRRVAERNRPGSPKV